MGRKGEAPNLLPAEWSSLGVVSEGPTHGYEVARLLGPDGPLGQIWTVTRPLTYRALTRLEELGYIEAYASEPSDSGPSRRLLRATPSGRARLVAWLGEPVQHVRDARSLLLLKLALLDRRSASPVDLLRAQRAVVVARIEDLSATPSDGFEAIVLRWRIESAEAVLRFVDGLLEST